MKWNSLRQLWPTYSTKSHRNRKTSPLSLPLLPPSLLVSPSSQICGSTCKNVAKSPMFSLLNGILCVLSNVPSLYHYRSTLDTPEWKACISQPSLPYVLKMLTGLCRWHTRTQLAIVPVIPELHLLEQVASDQHIGTMAENLLEAMMENTTCQEEVSNVPHGCILHR